jgi:uncharacterized glyoxalase superfamily protein PhnB
MHSLTPHIVVQDAARAAEWYASALGAEEHDRLELPGGKLLYVELWFGDSAVRVADEFPEAGVLSPRSIGGTPVVLHLFTDAVAALWKRAVDAGAEILHPLADQFWGDRQGQLTDPFGHRWNPAQACGRPARGVARAAAAAFEEGNGTRAGLASWKRDDSREYSVSKLAHGTALGSWRDARTRSPASTFVTCRRVTSIITNG